MLIIFFPEHAMLLNLIRLAPNKIQNLEKQLFLLLATRHIHSAITVEALEIICLLVNIVEDKDKVKSCT